MGKSNSPQPSPARQHLPPHPNSPREQLSFGTRTIGSWGCCQLNRSWLTSSLRRIALPQHPQVLGNTCGPSRQIVRLACHRGISLAVTDDRWRARTAEEYCQCSAMTNIGWHQEKCMYEQIKPQQHLTHRSASATLSKTAGMCSPQPHHEAFLQFGQVPRIHIFRDKKAR
jgi:hypothetical protein